MNYKHLFLFITIVGLMVFVGCNRTTKELTTTEPPKIERTEKASPPALESYASFYKKFHKDSIFQISRIMFPMKGHFIDTVGDLHKWNSNNWIIHRSEIQTVDTSVYKVELKDFNDFKTELLFIEGGGFKVERKFKRINGKWYLVYYTDENL